MMKRLFLLLIFGTSLALPALPARVARAVETCPNDYYSFIFTIGNEHTRGQVLKDPFTLGMCQLMDIYALNDELDTLRESFRSAAFACMDTSKFKADYKRILMEQYFIRNVVRKDPGVLKEEDLEKIETRRDELVEGLHDEMFQIFVRNEGYVNDSLFETYFESWRGKYQDKIGSYARCEQGAWAQLQATLDDFSETMQDLKEWDVKKYERETGLLDFDERVQVTDRTKQLFNSIKSFSFKKKKDLEAEEDTPDPKTVSDLGSQRFDLALEELTRSETLHTMELESQMRMGRYELLYGEASAITTDEIQSILKATNASVEKSNITHLPAIEVGLGKVYELQCR